MTVSLTVLGTAPPQKRRPLRSRYARVHGVGAASKFVYERAAPPTRDFTIPRRFSTGRTGVV